MTSDPLRDAQDRDYLTAQFINVPRFPAKICAGSGFLRCKSPTFAILRIET